MPSNQRDYRLALSRALDASQRAQESARQAADGQARARSEAELALLTSANDGAAGIETEGRYRRPACRPRS